MRHRACLEIDYDAATSRSRVRVRGLVWPVGVTETATRIDVLRKTGALDGLITVVEGDDELMLILEHVAFARTVRRALISSGIIEHVQRAALTALNPLDEPHTYSLEELLEEFLAARRKRASAMSPVATGPEAVSAAEAMVVALTLLEPVQAVLRTSASDEEACKKLMHFMNSGHREA